MAVAAKHELIEIIRTAKDRVPQRDALLTAAERELDRTLVLSTDSDLFKLLKGMSRDDPDTAARRVCGAK